MCEKCDRHLIEEHLRPLLGKQITTKRNVLLEVESLEAENGCLILRNVDTDRELRIIIWGSDASESIARAHSFIHHGGTIEGIHVPGETSLWSRFSREHPGQFYAILKAFHDVDAGEKRHILKLRE